MAKLVFLLAGALLVFALALVIGPSGFDVELIQLRFSRIALGAFAGSILGLCGTAMQALMRNPLADPYVLGVSGGAAAFGSAALLFLPFALTPVAAFLGAIVVSFLLLFVLRRENEQGRDRALLFGIAINALASSFITLLKTLAPMRDTQTLLFWLMGGISYLEVSWLLTALAVSLPFFMLILSRAQTLEILKLGDEEATRLGVAVSYEKRLIYTASSVLIGVCVSLCGMIAFVGLTTPHLLRGFVGQQERALMPASALFGATFVVAIDTVSRLGFSLFGTELHAGALLALVGAPIFMWILTMRGQDAES